MVKGIILINKETNVELELDMITTPYFILESCNWSTIQATHNSTQYVNQIGVNIDSTILGTRTIEIIGWVIADSEQEMDDRKTFLNSFINPLQEFDMIYKGYKITCKPNNTIAYNQSNSENNEVMAKFNISATAADPLFYDKDDVIVDILNTKPLFHFPFSIPLNEGIVFSERLSSRLINISLVSDLSTGAIFDFEFTVRTNNPSIKSVTDNKELYINYIFYEGDRLIVNTKIGERSIKIIKADGTELDGYKYMTINSEWVVLHPGDNVINILTHDIGSGVSTYITPDDCCNLSVYYNGRYLEVEGCY